MCFWSVGEMLDTVLVAYEIIEDVTKNKRKCVLLKVDYEKAYDSIRWKFLFYMMERLGFYNK